MKAFSSNNDSLTLHIRTTKKCNADCSYCSSFETKTSDLMPLEDLKKCIEFVKDLIINKNLAGNRKMLTVQYIGGEVMTVPKDYLELFTSLVKDGLSPLFKDFRHGAQSNLIGSQSRVESLINIFDCNIGTSVDHWTEQRTVKSSAKTYQKIFFQRLNYAKKTIGRMPSAVVVVDEKMAPHLLSELQTANRNKMHITLRPVFQGGMPVEHFSTQSMAPLYEKVFDEWFMKYDIIVEPHFSLLAKRFESKYNKNRDLSSISGCPFQHNCANVSLNLEPDGSLYVCQDMADSKNYCIGNAIKGVFNDEVFELLASRTQKLNNECISCDYFEQCQGGCMNESIEQGNGVFGKTKYCSTWKAVFAKIDNAIQFHGEEQTKKWIDRISF